MESVLIVTDLVPGSDTKVNLREITDLTEATADLVLDPERPDRPHVKPTFSAFVGMLYAPDRGRDNDAVDRR
jgi:hypothetical protein